MSKSKPDDIERLAQETASILARLEGLEHECLRVEAFDYFSRRMGEENKTLTDRINGLERDTTMLAEAMANVYARLDTIEQRLEECVD